MTRLARIVLVTSVLIVPLGGCASVSDALDPTDWFSGDFFNSKKKLPGDRKPVFPEGVPGVTQGIPSELVKGHQPQPEESGFASTDTQSVGSTPQQRTAAKTDTKTDTKTDAKADEFQPAPREKAKPKPKPKPATAERQPPAQDRQPTTARRAPEAQPQQQPQQQQPQQQAGGNAVQWPDPPPQRSGGQAGGIQWPDPPPMR
jgi:hypothetical protein